MCVNVNKIYKLFERIENVRNIPNRKKINNMYYYDCMYLKEKSSLFPSRTSATGRKTQWRLAGGGGSGMFFRNIFEHEIRSPRR